jgi:WD40 repeat protein
VAAILDVTRQAVFAPGGHSLLTMGDRLQQWSLDDGSEFAQLSHRTPVRGLAISRDGRFLATTTEDGLAHIWDTGDWHEMPPVEINPVEDNRREAHVAFSSDDTGWRRRSARRSKS